MIVGGVNRRLQRFIFNSGAVSSGSTLPKGVQDQLEAFAPWAGPGVDLTVPDTTGGITWGEKWRYDDPFHALGMVPMAGLAYRLVVIGGSYLLDLFTAEQQGITVIQFEGDEPAWMKSHLLL